MDMDFDDVSPPRLESEGKEKEKEKKKTMRPGKGKTIKKMSREKGKREKQHAKRQKVRRATAGLRVGPAQRRRRRVSVLDAIMRRQCRAPPAVHRVPPPARATHRSQRKSLSIGEKAT